MFKIKKENDVSVNLSDAEAFNLILKQCLLDDQNPHLLNLNKHIEIISKTLKKDLLKTNLNQMFSVYFLAGYYYKVFLLKNNPEIIHTNEEKQ
jgi:hypothetical protein